jgi:hypothetical protein
MQAQHVERETAHFIALCSSIVSARNSTKTVPSGDCIGVRLKLDC